MSRQIPLRQEGIRIENQRMCLQRRGCMSTLRLRLRRRDQNKTAQFVVKMGREMEKICDTQHRTKEQKRVGVVSCKTWGWDARVEVVFMRGSQGWIASDNRTGSSSRPVALFGPIVSRGNHPSPPTSLDSAPFAAPHRIGGELHQANQATLWPSSPP